MNRVNELIKEYCPDGVEIRCLEDCCNLLDKKRKPITKAAREAGEYPYYGANGIQDNVANYIFDGTFVLVGEDGSVITKSGTPVVTWAEGKIWVNNHAHIIEEKDGVMLRYLYHYLQTIDVTSLIHGNIPKLTGGDFKALKIAVPPLEVQREIVHILDSFTLLTAELTAELTARKKQYEFYRDKLLTGEKMYPVGRIIDMLSQPITDGPHSTPKLVEEGIPFLSAESVYDGRIHFEKKRGYITDEFDIECCKKYKPQKNDVFMVKSGSTTGKVGFVDTDERFNIWSPLAAMRTNENNSARFLFHLLQSEKIQKQVRAKASHGSQPNLSMRALEQFEVPIPPLEIQSKIATVLDNFDAICADLNIGLPAEIEARQKQYEYYRDLLLTFAETGNMLAIDRQTDRQTELSVIKLIQYVFGYAKVNFGSIATIVRGSSPRPIKNYITENCNGVNWIKIGDIKPNTKYVTATAEKITKEGAKKSRFVHPGDFILSNSMSFGRPYILKIEGCIHDGWLSISNFNDIVIPDYLYHLLNSNSVQQEMKQRASFGGAVQNLNADIVKSLKLNIPSLEVQ